MNYSKIKVAFIALVAGIVLGAGIFAFVIMRPSAPKQGGEGSGSHIVASEGMKAQVYTEQGEAISIADIAAGRPMLLNFWATWCPFCVDDLPELEELRGQYGDRIVFTYVDMSDGDRETAEDAAAWLVENGYNDLPVFYDNDVAAGNAFALEYLPTVVLISSDGTIVEVYEESIDVEVLTEALESLS